MKDRVLWGVAVVALGATFAAGFAAPAALATNDGDRAAPARYLDQARRGEDAIKHLGDKLPEVASLNQTSASAFRSELRRDDRMWVDPTGLLFAVEPALGTVDDTALSTPTGIADEDTFLLHSKPGSNRVIYLDFDGETIQNTAWNQSYTGGATWNAEPYDSDGSPSTFSSAERDAIEGVWLRVAEDYAPFDVDVTTEPPPADDITRSGSTDQRYGTRVLITNSTTGYSSCGCGGVAYVGTFDHTSAHSYYQPALVFQRGLGSGAKNLAEAASHEAGHNLGLGHDGTASTGYYRGQGAWAPIMGVGYDRPVSQWSRGEYSGANNTEDDFAVMATNGAAVRADDHGGTTATATVLSGSPATATGRITSRGDVDAFLVEAGAGPATFTVTPASTSPNLDVLLRVLDVAGNVVGSSDPAVAYVSRDSATGLGAELQLELAAGTYTITVDGTGYGSPTVDGYSDYGSLGTYRLTSSVTDGGTPPPPPPPPPPLTAPAAPTGATASVSGTTVSVGWTDNATNESGFEIVRETYNARKGTWGSATLVATLAADSTSWSAGSGNGTFRYRVRSVNAAGASTYAVTNSVTVQGSKGGGKPKR